MSNKNYFIFHPQITSDPDLPGEPEKRFSPEGKNPVSAAFRRPVRQNRGDLIASFLARPLLPLD
jgi:hypothetical protein